MGPNGSRATSMNIPIPLQEALRDSITTGTFVDTKFWVSSKRNSRTGRVGEPQALFVNGHVVRSVSRLGALLDKKETKVNLRNKFPVDRKPYTTDYDYDADSDLDEDECWDLSESECTAQPVPENPKGKSGESDSSTLVGSPLDAKSRKSSDIISVSDVDSLLSDSAETKAEVKEVGTPPIHVGTVVVVEDVAFVTFQALLRYLYTNEIEFAPWGSAERRKARAREETTEPCEPPKPSPKSVYRLADKYEIPGLKKLALEQIKRDISKCDIVEEAFSKFTSRYPELRELELEHLALTLTRDSGPTLNALKEKIKAYTSGQLSHAEDILPALYELMRKDKPFEETQTQTPAPPQEGSASDGDWKRLKDALTWSLTTGSFLDSQFYALDSKPQAPATPAIRPIYFCSLVDGNFSSRVTKYSSRIWPSSKTRLPCVVDYDSDVDEGGSGIGIPVDTRPRSVCIPEDNLPTYKAPAPSLVLKSGTAKTWSAIFFYVYTSRIAFAPLSSRGIKRAAEEDGTSGSSAPVPNPSQQSGVADSSSPKHVVMEARSKSVYALASKIDLTCLRDLAFDDIKSQLDENNIVQELLSPFTADHEPVRQMQHSLLFSRLRPSVEGPSFLETIRGSASGEHPHRAVAMEQIFEKAIYDCRERVLYRTKKPSQEADPAVQPNGGKKEAPKFFPTTQLGLPPIIKSVPKTTQPPQPSQTQQGLPKPQSSQFPPSGQSSGTPFSFFNTAQPATKPIVEPTTQPAAKATAQSTSSDKVPTFSFNFPSTSSKPQQPIRYPDPFAPLDRNQRK